MRPGAVGSGGVRAELGRFAELAALAGFAVVQPVLGPFAESPQTFVAAGATAGEVVAFGLAVTLVPLLAVGAVAALSGLAGPRTRRWVQTALVGLLAGLAVVYALRDLAGSGGFQAGVAARVVAGLAGAVGAGVAHHRWAPVPIYLRFASPAPLLLLGVFLFASPVAPLVRPEQGEIAEARGGDHPSVIVVVLDELPTLSLVAGGEIDAELFPNLAELAATSTWYRNHTTVSPDTAVALPAIVTGRLPPTEGDDPAVHTVHPDNLFTLLAPTHRVHAVEWVTDLCPPTVCRGEDVAIDEGAAALAPGLASAPPPALRSLLDVARSLWWGQAWPVAEPPVVSFNEPAAEDPEGLVRPALRFLGGLAAGDRGDRRPVLDYLHAPLPHQPWFLLPSGSGYDAPVGAVGLDFRSWRGDGTGQALADASRSRHLLQLQWTDRLLGEIVDRLRELDRWDDSVVVVTADHGISFAGGTMARELEVANRVELGWSPLFVKAPGQQEGVVDDRNALSVDVLPTVADLAGVEIPWDVDGVSLARRDGRTSEAKPIRPSVNVPYDGDVDAAGYADLGDDGLHRILDVPAAGGAPDELRAWRHGELGDLLGRRVDELPRCGAGPEVDVDLPDRERARSPVWLDGVVRAGGRHDVVVAVEGVVAGWAPSRPTFDGAPFGVLLAEPLLEQAAGIDPGGLAGRHLPGRLELFEVAHAFGCMVTLQPVP